ncbi:metallophosphoesterase family protein [Aliarcobacter cryaerophilus]|uniref:metallophosphoesterase family protein n=1 Tax=Aliarcobacter cryaerophilus TaxID=28198 RepID=UPI001AD90221|nr:metallophosphoesterase family protein [Aliarcobacter cryaerophilus]
MIAIVSDIHGNLPALEAVIEDIKSYDIKQIISLGDVSGYYPFINEVIEILKENNAINIIGNHDRYIIDNTECPRSHSANICLNYQKSVITNENKEWLKTSISKYEIDNISMVHGGWVDNEDEYMMKIKDDYFEKLPFKYFFCGHTHVQKHIKLKNNKEFINPGSVGQPRDGNKEAAYCLFDEKIGEVILKRVYYDIDKVALKMKEIGFEEKLYENLYNGTRIGGKVDFIRYDEDKI